MDISIIIPSYNTQHTIDGTLTNICSQSTDLHYEVIVVDCSPHLEVEEIAQRYSKVKFHHQDQRFNPGEGRNIGARLAQGDLLIFVDSDVHLAPGTLAAVWRNFQNGKDIFGGSLELNATVDDSTAAYLEHYFFNHESQAWRPAAERNNLSSALMCFKREIFIKEGGFKDIPRMQDTELTERLRKKGYKLYFCPDIRALQIQDSPMKKVLKKIYINGQNLYYIRYQPGISKTRKVMFFFILPAFALTKISRIIARHLRYQNWPNKFRTLAMIPLFLLAIGYWTAGFYHALLTEKGISRER
jgi:Predicted glycosyltransferases